MPYRSDKQRRYIFMEAAAGKAWAIKFIKDSGDKPPPVTAAARKRALADMRKKR